MTISINSGNIHECTDRNMFLYSHIPQCMLEPHHSRPYYERRRNWLTMLQCSLKHNHVWVKQMSHSLLTVFRNTTQTNHFAAFISFSMFASGTEVIRFSVGSNNNNNTLGVLIYR